MGSDFSLDKVTENLGYDSANGFYTKNNLPNHADLDLDKVDVDAVYGKESDDESYLPLVYFKEFENHDKDKIRDLFRKIWNQSQVPVLILVLPEKVQIYNCTEKPPYEAGEQIEDSKRILNTLRAEKDIVESAEKLNFSKSNVEDIDFWKENSKYFKEDTRVDEQLLSHLLSLRRHLSENLEDTYVNSLVVKTIFVKYLEDRGILNEEFYNNHDFEESEFIEILNYKEKTYKLFRTIKEEYNGEIFRTRGEEEKVVEEENLQSIQHFLKGQNLSTNQTTLNDFPYSFDIIPVELISKVYERFVNNPEGDYVHYTPQPLAKYMVEDISSKKLDEPLKVLDPACGSGIFLVNILGKIIENRDLEATKENLIGIIKNEIYGVDKNEEAVHIAAFSLYLKVFEYLNNEEIRDDFRLPSLIGESLFIRDYFDQESDFNEVQYDLILGNPPWGRYSVGDQEKAKEYASDKTVGNKQLAQLFMWKSLDLAKESAELCLLIPSDAVLLNKGDKTKKFRQEYFSKTKIETVVNLSILRHDLFKGATKPSAIINFQKDNQDENQKQVQYITPRSSESNLLRRIIIDSNFDVKYLPFEFLENGFLWKTAMWGGIKDFELMLELKENQTLGDFCKEKEGITKPEEGFVSNHSRAPEKENNHMPFVKEMNYLETGDFEAYNVPRGKMRDYDKGEYFYTPKPRSLFDAPLLIVKERATKRKIGGESPRRLKSSYLEEDTLFNQSFVGIQAEAEEKDILKILNLYLNSTLSQFYFFMSPNLWGVERPIISQEQIESFPISVPEKESDEWKRLVNLHDEILVAKEAKNWETLSLLEKEVDDLIFGIYDLTEDQRKLVQDRVKYTIDFFHKGAQAKSVERAGYEEIKSYSQIISKSINQILNQRDYRIVPKIYIEKKVRTLDSTKKIPLPAISLIPVEESSEEDLIEKDAEKELVSELKSREEASIVNRASQKSFFRRNIQIFEGDRIHIIKPSEIRFWTDAEAVNDASELLGDLIGE